jgi:DNA-binding PadR family transcriptional regulator
MLAKEPSHGYELRARLDRALGPLGEGMNAGQIYVVLGRLEKAGLVVRDSASSSSDHPDRKVYGLTVAGEERVGEWLTEVSWPKPDLAEFHLKLIAAAQGALADPISIVDLQRREPRRVVAGPRRSRLCCGWWSWSSQLCFSSLCSPPSQPESAHVDRSPRCSSRRRRDRYLRSRSRVSRAGNALPLMRALGVLRAPILVVQHSGPNGHNARDRR